MKVLSVPAAISGCVLGLSLVGPVQAQPQQQSQDFQLAFCNISAFSAVVVALVRKEDAERWVVDGWYPVPNGGCAWTTAPMS